MKEKKNQKKTLEERRLILRQLIGYIKKHSQYRSLVDIGKRINVSTSALSYWQDGKNDPLKIPSYNLWKLLELRGWSLDKFMLYLEGEISYQELTQREINVTKAAINLPSHERFRHVIHTMESLEQEFTAISDPEFTRVLNEWVKAQNITLQEAARITKIYPASRFEAILKGLRPTQRELINLAVCERFLKPDGQPYDLSDLEILVTGNLDG